MFTHKYIFEPVPTLQTTNLDEYVDKYEYTSVCPRRIYV